MKYAFIQAYEAHYPVRRLCHVMDVHPSGYYAWKFEPASPRRREDQRLLGLIKQFWLESGGVYGYRKVAHDLRDVGERCGKHRVYRLMKQEGLRAQVGYRRRPGHYGKPAVVAENHLEQNFDVAAPNQAWVTDITYIRTHEGWLYLAVVIDLYSRAVIGWSMKPSMQTEIVLDALPMAVWRRKPRHSVIIHSDQGSQFGSDDFVRWSKDNRLIPSMSRRGNCYDNAVAESFFSNLKKERIKRKIYATKEEAKSEIFDYIEVFYNRTRRHSFLHQLSPMAFEQLQTGR